MSESGAMLISLKPQMLSDDTGPKTPKAAPIIPRVLSALGAALLSFVAIGSLLEAWQALSSAALAVTCFGAGIMIAFAIVLLALAVINPVEPEKGGRGK